MLPEGSSHDAAERSNGLAQPTRAMHHALTRCWSRVRKCQRMSASIQAANTKTLTLTRVASMAHASGLSLLD
ncbi:MAG: hypothetical protein WDM79_19445 [Terricaulis sp.]